MGSRTKFFGTVLAMLAVNSIYMQLQQLALRLEVDSPASEQSSAGPQSHSEPRDPLRRLARGLRRLRLTNAGFLLPPPSDPSLHP